MDTLNHLTARLAEWAKTTTPSTWLAAAVVLAGVVACAVWTAGPLTASGDVYLMGGQVFSAAELRDIESALGKAQLRDYEVDGARVRVPAGQQARYMAALAEEGALPADFGEYLRRAVNTNSFMMSGPRQEAQMKVAVQSELQSVINNFHGVERSSVQIAEQTSGFPPVKTVTASVSVQPSAHEKLNAQTASAIRWIVASAWAGLQPEHVTVVDLSDNRLFTGPIEDQSGQPAPGDYADLKKQLERDWQEKIDRLLAIPGAVVMTNVELTPGTSMPARVSASIGVPAGYYLALWRRQHPVAPGTHAPQPDPSALGAIAEAETRRIRAALLPLLGSNGSGADPSTLLAVTTIYPPASATDTPQNFDQQAIAWLAKNWQPVGVGVLLVLGLCVLHSSLRRGTSSQVASAADELPESISLVTEGDRHLLPASPDDSFDAASSIPAPHYRERELADRVRQDPAAAASVLRNWIGNSH